MASASVAGLFTGLYRDNTLVTAAFQGNDLVTLLVAVPLLLAAEAYRRRSMRAEIIRLGVVGYALYNYAFYLFGARFNELFLVYAVLVVLSVGTLIVELRRLELAPVAVDDMTRRSDRRIAAFLAFFGVLIAGLWISRIVSFLLTGDIPDDITRTEHPTAVVYALDLTLLAPSVIASAVLLWTRWGWGRVFAIIVCVKATTYSLALIGMSYFADRAGVPDAWELTALWSALGAGTLASALILLRGARGVVGSSAQHATAFPSDGIVRPDGSSRRQLERGVSS